jgi:hypothetical protein
MINNKEKKEIKIFNKNKVIIINKIKIIIK